MQPLSLVVTVLASILLFFFLPHPLKGGREKTEVAVGSQRCGGFLTAYKTQPTKKRRFVEAQDTAPPTLLNQSPATPPAPKMPRFPEQQLSVIWLRPPAPFPPKAVTAAEHGGTRLWAVVTKSFQSAEWLLKEGSLLRGDRLSLTQPGPTAPFTSVHRFQPHVWPPR